MEKAKLVEFLGKLGWEPEREMDNGNVWLHRVNHPNEKKSFNSWDGVPKFVLDEAKKYKQRMIKKT